MRSGKSRFAEEVASQLGADSVLYVATAVVDADDPDLACRVAAHRERRPDSWGLLELAGEGLGIVAREARRYQVVLLDSLTLWVASRAQKAGGMLEDLEGLMRAARSGDVPVVLVSDEVGLGGIAENAAARGFADSLGLANQRVAELADEVYLCVAGVPVRIKPA